MRRSADSYRPGETPRELIWAEIRRRPAAAIAGSISDRTGILCRTVHDYLLALDRAGYLELVADAAQRRDRVYALVRDIGHEAPRVRRDGSIVEQGGGTEAMWRTMQHLAEFGVLDIAQHATTDRCTVSEAAAASYVSGLLRAGYLRIVRPGNGNRAERAIYRLIRRTGPKPPQLQRCKQVYDPNTGEVHGARERVEEPA